MVPAFATGGATGITGVLADGEIAAREALSMIFSFFAAIESAAHIDGVNVP
tara:strand:+ start:459 stop:611 length:153 start_codon:yes stop_codon:yes gene_type:complete